MVGGEEANRTEQPDGETSRADHQRCSQVGVSRLLFLSSETTLESLLIYNYFSKLFLNFIHGPKQKINHKSSVGDSEYIFN